MCCHENRNPSQKTGTYISPYTTIHSSDTVGSEVDVSKGTNILNKHEYTHFNLEDTTQL